MQPGTLNCSGCSLIVLAVLLALNAPVVLSDASSQPQSEAGVCLMQKQSTHMKKVKAVSDAMESGKSSRWGKGYGRYLPDGFEHRRRRRFAAAPPAAEAPAADTEALPAAEAPAPDAEVPPAAEAPAADKAATGATHTAAKLKSEEEAAAKLKAEEEAATKLKAEEAAAAELKAEEEAAAKRKAEEEAAAKLKAEEETAAKLKAEEEAAAKLKAEEEAAAKLKAEEEAAAKLKAEEEAAAKLKAEQEAEAPAADKAATGAAEKLSEGRCKGDVIRKVSISTVGDCQSYCEETEGCKFFSFRESKKKCEASRKCNSFSGANKDWMSYKMP